ncbi:MAG: glycosyltransferase [Clostridia bacterium]|nr:glycosyltransferase [Clostridia bacterium]
MDKKKVLIIAHHLTVGGAQNALIATLPLIDYDKYDVTLYVRKNRMELADKVDPRVNVIVNDDPTRYYRKPVSALLTVLQAVSSAIGAKKAEKKLGEKLGAYIRRGMRKYELEHYFKDKKYDVGICFFQGYTMDILADGIEADRKCAFYHSSVDEAHDFHQKAFEKMDAIVVVSPAVKPFLEQCYPSIAGKVQVIENFIDADEIIKKGGEFTVPESGDKIMLCSCGRFADDKGFDLAAKAAARLKEKGLDFIWYFVGDGPERPKVEAIIDGLGLKDDIVLTGMQQNPYPWMKACDIFVQPSLAESYGRTIKEAMMLGTPVVATNTVGACHVLENGKKGILTPISTQGLFEGVLKMAENRELRKSFAGLYSLEQNQEERREYARKISLLIAGDNNEI